MGIETKIFLGCQLTKDIEIALNHSKTWQSEKQINQTSLDQTEKEGKSYLGVYLNSPACQPEIKEKEKILKTKLQLYCPKLNLDQHNFLLFPQLFIV